MQRYEMGYSPETGDTDMVPFEYGEWCKFWEARKGYTKEDIIKAAEQLEEMGFHRSGRGRPKNGARPIVPELCKRLGLSDAYVLEVLSGSAQKKRVTMQELQAQVAALTAERDALRARVAELEAPPVVPEGWAVEWFADSPSEGVWCLFDGQGIAVEADTDGVTHAEAAAPWAALRALEHAIRTDQRPPHAGDE